MLTINSNGWRPALSAAIILFLAVIWPVICYQSFLRYYFLPGANAVLWVFPLLLLLDAWYYYAVSNREKRFLKKAFSYYFNELYRQNEKIE